MPALDAATGSRRCDDHPSAWACASARWQPLDGYSCGMLGPAGTEPGARPLMTEPRRLDLSDPDTLRRLWELQRAAYAVEAELIGFDGIPPLHESLRELRDCGESFLGLDDEAGLAGAVSWTRLTDGTLDICRLMVHPRAHRRGIASALLDSLDRLEPAPRAVVSTGTGNYPALTLYRRRGFTSTRTRQIAPAATLTFLERRNTPPRAQGS